MVQLMTEKDPLDIEGGVKGNTEGLSVKSEDTGKA